MDCKSCMDEIWAWDSFDDLIFKPYTIGTLYNNNQITKIEL